MFPSRNCDKQYIGETSKKIETWLTEHKNAIRRHDPRSLPATHADDNGRKFDWSQTKLLGQASTRHARKFKEAWHSMDKSTINRHVDIPTIYHQLKHHKRHHPSYPPNNNNRTDTPQTNEQEKPTTGGSTQDKANPIRWLQTNNENTAPSNEPIRCSHRLQSQRFMDKENESHGPVNYHFWRRLEGSSWKLKEKLTKPGEQRLFNFQLWPDYKY